MKRVWAIYTLCSYLLCGCGYHFEGKDATKDPMTISVPYIPGDATGNLNTLLVQTLNASGLFECQQSGSQWILEVSLIADNDERIGYRYDRDPTTGKRRKNIIGTENRHTVTAEVKVIDTYTGEILLGPETIKGFTEYDYVDSNSIRDLTFIPTGGNPNTVLDFSLGQLDSVEGAHEDSFLPAYQDLTRKILDGLVMSLR